MYKGEWIKRMKESHEERRQGVAIQLAKLVHDNAAGNDALNRCKIQTPFGTTTLSHLLALL